MPGLPPGHNAGQRRRVAVPQARVLLVTGIGYPGRVWHETAPVLRAQLEKDPRAGRDGHRGPATCSPRALTNYAAVLLHFQNWEKPGPGREATCVTAAGDFAFTGGWKERGRIWVNRLSDGAELGVFDPGPTVGGVENTGWIDLLTGINAFRRRNGEYLVFVEENYKAQSLIYRWKP